MARTSLPSGGSQVLLHNGEPLYGPGQPPSFSPLMRQTNCVIDRAGNVWAINNWKPNFDVDVRANPGGDGIVIFVGLAKPPSRSADSNDVGYGGQFRPTMSSRLGVVFTEDSVSAADGFRPFRL